MTMTASIQTVPETRGRSRRALLAGALGGLGAWAASTVVRPTKVPAADGDPVLLGSLDNTESTVTKITNTNSGNALWGVVPAGAAILGSADNGAGVVGIGGSPSRGAVEGRSSGNGTGELGFSGSGINPTAKAKTGVYGFAGQDTGSVGVWGETPAGLAVYGKTSSGYAGYFNGKVYTSQFYELGEVTSLAAPVANRARLFIRDNGGKTQLCVRFHTGVVKVLATEPLGKSLDQGNPADFRH
jgi:hypothetical protein